MDTHQQLLEKIVSFCEQNEKVSTLILIGSQARTELHADEYSDLDLIMIASDVAYFIESNDWVKCIGAHHISFVEPTIGGQKEKRILFDNALDVDFVVVSKEYAQDVLASDDALSILSKGYRFLVNKDSYTIPEQIIKYATTYEIPSEAEYVNVVNDFWYHTIWSAKKLLRGELWSAKFCIDSYLKWKLLWMIEHYEHVTHGPEYNTWYGGRFIDSWSDDEVKDGLAKSFSNYKKADMTEALFETMSLFRSLATKVAQEYSFVYPRCADEYSSNWLRKVFYDHADTE
ncbi:MAG: aminoglycoside 6-adenylyltransferase [Lachnospiraceae bacterium]